MYIIAIEGDKINTENASFGLKIRAIRERQGLSREKLAELANISTQFLADIETGKKGMTVITLKKICTALRVSSDLIVFNRNNIETDYLNSMISTLPPEKREEIQNILQMIIHLI